MIEEDQEIEDLFLDAQRLRNELKEKDAKILHMQL